MKDMSTQGSANGRSVKIRNSNSRPGSGLKTNYSPDRKFTGRVVRPVDEPCVYFSINTRSVGGKNSNNSEVPQSINNAQDLSGILRPDILFCLLYFKTRITIIRLRFNFD